MHIVFPIYRWNKNSTSASTHIATFITQSAIQKSKTVLNYIVCLISVHPSLSNSTKPSLLPCVSLNRWVGVEFFRPPKKQQIKESIFCGSAVNATFPCLIIATWKIFYPLFIFLSLFLLFIIRYFRSAPFSFQWLCEDTKSFILYKYCGTIIMSIFCGKSCM